MTEARSKKARLPKGARTRATIKDAALGLYAASGWKGVTIEDLCHATGLTVGAFYFHFESKDALLEELSSEISTRHHAGLIANIAWDSGELFEIIFNLIQHYYRGYIRNPVEAKLVYAVIVQRPAARQTWRSHREEVRGRLETAIERTRRSLGGPAAGPTAALTSQWLLSSLEDFAWSVFIAKGNADLADVAAGPDAFVRQQAILWYRAAVGKDPAHRLARMSAARRGAGRPAVET